MTNSTTAANLGRKASGSLTTGEWLLAAVCLVYPFRVLLDTIAQLSLHLGMVCFALVGGYAFYSVRRRAPGFPDALDLAVGAFVVVAVLDLILLGPPTRLALKGFSVEIRFAIFYATARFLRIGRPFGFWLLAATMVLGIAGAVFGIAEYHLDWGGLLEAAGTAPDRRFAKVGVARLYSFPMTPVGAAFLFLLALAAAIAFTIQNRKLGVVVVTALTTWQAMLLTLTRTTLALGILITAIYAAAGGRRGRWFAALSVVGVAIGIFTFWLRGWVRPLANYAAVGGSLADGSAESHAKVLASGYDLIAEGPWGYGLGQAGHLAMWNGGIFPRDDTYYVTLGVQMGLPGLVAFGVVIALTGWIWLRMLRSDDVDDRALGAAGAAIWLALTAGGIYLPTFTMVVPQLYFWLLTAVAANRLHEREAR